MYLAAEPLIDGFSETELDGVQRFQVEDVGLLLTSRQLPRETVHQDISKEISTN
jgi:hypothetical protein